MLHRRPALLPLPQGSTVRVMNPRNYAATLQKQQARRQRHHHAMPSLDVHGRFAAATSVRSHGSPLTTRTDGD